MNDTLFLKYLYWEGNKTLTNFFMVFVYICIRKFMSVCIHGGFYDEIKCKY